MCEDLENNKCLALCHVCTCAMDYSQKNWVCRKTANICIEKKCILCKLDHDCICGMVTVRENQKKNNSLHCMANRHLF